MIGLKQLVLLKHGAPPRNVLEAALRAKWGGGSAGYEKTVGPLPIISISDAKPKPAKSLIMGMEPIQDLHGYDSPWPAGGGKNKFDALFMTATGITVTGNTVVGKGSAFHNAFAVNGIPNLTFAEDTQYTLSMVASTDASASASGNGLLFRLTYTDSTTNALWLQNTSTSPTPYQITSDAGKTIADIKMSYGGTSGENTWTLTNIQLEVGSSASDFAPYSNICPITGRTGANIYRYAEYDADAQPTYIIQLGQTVYGCTVDVVSGVLTVTHGMVDLGTLTWTMVGSYAINRFDAIVPGMTASKTAPFSDGILCSAYNPSNVPITQVNVDDTIARYSGRVFVCDSAYSDAASFTSGVSGVQLCYELAEQQTIQLTPQQIQLLKGSNTLWSDADSLTLTYIGTTPPNLLGGMLGGGLGGGYTPPEEETEEEEQVPEEEQAEESDPEEVIPDGE